MFTRTLIRDNFFSFEMPNVIEKFKFVMVVVDKDENKKQEYYNVSQALKFISAQIGTEKEFYDYQRLEKSIEVSNVIKSVLAPGNPGLEIIITSFAHKSIDEVVRGTYVHPYLFQDVIHWASPKYAAKVAIVMHNYQLYMGSMQMAESNRKHEEVIRDIRTSSERQLADAQVKHDKQIEEIRLNRKEIIEKHNSVVRRFNEQKSILTDTKSELTTTKFHLATIQSSCKTLTDQLINMTIKNDKLRAIVVETHAKVSSLPINLIKPESRSFDVVVKPKNKMTTSFLILTVIRIIRPEVKTYYTINRIQYRNHKTAVKNSIGKVIQKYTNPTYDCYYAFFESSASAITTWNIVKNTMKISNGSILDVDETGFYKLLDQLREINIKPEDELKILNDEYERLKNSTDQEDKEFLAEIEAAEDF